MKNKIKLYFILLTLISLLSFMIMTIFWINNHFLNISKNNLDYLLNTTVSLTKDKVVDYESFVKDLSKNFNNNIRVMIIDTNGDVLFESKENKSKLENHFLREEVQQAIKTGSGSFVRKSETTGIKTLYEARKWQDGKIIRFSIPISETKNFSKSITPLLFLNTIIIVFFLNLLIDKTSENITKPLKNMFLYMKEKITTGKSDVKYEIKYEEIEDIEICFNELFDTTTDYIETINKTKNDIKSIIKSMQEGFIMLDKYANIVIINDRACRFLQIKKENEDKNIKHLYRNIEFKNAMELIKLNKENSTLDIKQNKMVLRFYLNSANDDGYIILISDVTELVRLDNMRSEFTSNVTHELKTPLTSISGFAELISTGMITDITQITNFNDKIFKESKRMIALVDDILKLSDIENSKKTINEKVNVRKIFIYVFEVLKSQLENKNITFEIEGNLEMFALENRIYELAFNLAGNAIKYNNQGGKIFVKMFEKESLYGFSVTDTGIGIPKKDIAHIFERFYRVNNARDRKTGGTGLGLAIVKHIVELYNGEIKVNSDSKGTEFVIVFK